MANIVLNKEQQAAKDAIIPFYNSKSLLTENKLLQILTIFVEFCKFIYKKATLSKCQSCF